MYENELGSEERAADDLEEALKAVLSTLSFNIPTLDEIAPRWHDLQNAYARYIETVE